MNYVQVDTDIIREIGGGFFCLPPAKSFKILVHGIKSLKTIF